MNHAMTFVREEVGIAVLQSFSSTSPCSPSAHTRIKADEQKHPEKIGKESDFGHCRTCPMHGMHSMNSDDFELSPSTLSSFQTGSPCGYLPWWLDWLDTSAFCSRDSECSEKLPGLTLDICDVYLGTWLRCQSTALRWAVSVATQGEKSDADETCVLVHVRYSNHRPKKHQKTKALAGKVFAHSIHFTIIHIKIVKSVAIFFEVRQTLGRRLASSFSLGAKKRRCSDSRGSAWFLYLMNSLRSEWWNTMEYYEIQLLLPCFARCFASDRGEGHKIQTTCNKYQGTCMNLYSCGLR